MVPVVVVLLLLAAGVLIWFCRCRSQRAKNDRAPPAEIIEMIENPMPAAAAARAASFGSPPAAYAAVVQAGDVIYVSDNGAAAGDLAEQQDEASAMATYSVPHANRDPRYSGYEAPGTNNGGGNNGITYAIPMEGDDGQYENVEDYPAPDTNQDPRYAGYEAPGTNNGRGGSNNITYATPIEDDDGAGRVPNPMYQSADGNGRELTLSLIHI